MNTFIRAIETWVPGNDRAILEFGGGIYGSTGDTFEFISRSTSFRQGTGLPGMAWQRGVPVFLEDLGKGSGFLRADSAVQVGINRGFALPCSTPGADHYVMAFLSALATPLTRRFEIWLLDAQRQHLQLAAGFDESTGTLAPQTRSLARGEGLVGLAFGSGVPAFSEGHDDTGAPTATAAIPILQHGRLRAVVALHL